MAIGGKKAVQWQRLLFLTGSVWFPRPSSRVLWVCTHALQVNCIRLN